MRYKYLSHGNLYLKVEGLMIRVFFRTVMSLEVFIMVLRRQVEPTWHKDITFCRTIRQR